MFGDHGLGGLLEEGTHGKSPKCLGGNLGDFGEFCKGLDLLIPFGFSDDIAVIALVYSQMKNYLTEDIQEKARQAADKLFGS